MKWQIYYSMHRLLYSKLQKIYIFFFWAAFESFILEYKIQLDTKTISSDKMAPLPEEYTTITE